MHKNRVWITICFCLFAITITASSQAIRKPGLWEVTSNMSWQKSPMPAGVNLPPGMKSPYSGMTITTQVCYTQAMIDRYGAPVSQNQRDCKIENVVLHTNSMTADMICSGRMNGKGEMQFSSTDGNTATGKTHFAGTMQMGQNTTPVEWTNTFTSTYKGPDCGSIKPPPMPQN
ncbi:MAG: DUF3617 domain-containing protein [Terracidiphilus sp.]